MTGLRASCSFDGSCLGFHDAMLVSNLGLDGAGFDVGLTMVTVVSTSKFGSMSSRSISMSSSGILDWLGSVGVEPRRGISLSFELWRLALREMIEVAQDFTFRGLLLCDLRGGVGGALIGNSEGEGSAGEDIGDSESTETDASEVVAPDAAEIEESLSRCSDQKKLRLFWWRDGGLHDEGEA